MIVDGRELTDAQRIRLLTELEADERCTRNDIGRIHAGEFDPEPRRYPPDPFADTEIATMEPEDKFYNESALSYRFSEAIRQTHRAQLQASRRALVKRAAWVAGMTVAVLVGTLAAFYVAGWVANLILDWLP